MLMGPRSIGLPGAEKEGLVGAPGYPQGYAGMAEHGIRDGLKHHCPQGLVGSNPTPGTALELKEPGRAVAGRLAGAVVKQISMVLVCGPSEL